jgi:outer membrane protein OmpA-like peptidoglycan-associated protein
MRPKTNRLLMLLVGAAISGCASQTDRGSSGGGDQAQTEPEKESVQFIDRSLEDTPPPKPAAVAVPPKAVPKDEATPDFPVTKYELPEEQAKAEEVEDLGPQDDDSLSAEQDAIPAEDSSVGETTEYADDQEAADSSEVEDLGPQDDDSTSAQQDAMPAEDSSIGETTEYTDDQEAADSSEVEDLGPQDDDSTSAQQDAMPAEDSSIGETTEYADDQQADAQDSGEVEDLGTQPDESGTVTYPEEKRADAGNVVGEPKVYQDEPAPKKPVTPAPKSVSVTYETEPLFNFDKSDIRTDQRAKLDEFISGLGGTQYESISVIGHADRIGKNAYNQKLSERRAKAVKAYLVRKGVPADKIQAEGHGKAESVTGDSCTDARGKALISCLQPDRRVDVSVNATKQSN